MLFNADNDIDAAVFSCNNTCASDPISVDTAVRAAYDYW